MDDVKFLGTKMVSSDFLRVLLALKENIMKDLKVATLAIVKSIDEKTQTCIVEPFPLLENEKNKNINCIINNSDDLSIKDIVLVIFLDRNFLQNLGQIKNQQEKTNLKRNTELHSEKYGIIISKIISKNIAKNIYPINWLSNFENNILSQTLEMNDGSKLSNSINITIQKDELYHHTIRLITKIATTTYTIDLDALNKYNGKMSEMSGLNGFLDFFEENYPNTYCHGTVTISEQNTNDIIYPISYVISDTGIGELYIGYISNLFKEEELVLDLDTEIISFTDNYQKIII